MSPIIKEHLVSIVQIFITTFITIAGLAIKEGTMEWTIAFWGSVVLSAVMAVVKELFAKFAPLSFGGRIGPTVLGRRNS